MINSKNREGMTLVEVIIAMGIISLVVYAINSLVLNITKTENTMRNNADMFSLVSYIESLASNAEFCSIAFTGHYISSMASPIPGPTIAVPTTTASPAITYINIYNNASPVPKPVVSPGMPYGSLTINYAYLSIATPSSPSANGATYNAQVVISAKKPSGMSSSSPNSFYGLKNLDNSIYNKIFLNLVLDSSNRILTCSSTIPPTSAPPGQIDYSSCIRSVHTDSNGGSGIVSCPAGMIMNGICQSDGHNSNACYDAAGKSNFAGMICCNTKLPLSVSGTTTVSGPSWGSATCPQNSVVTGACISSNNNSCNGSGNQVTCSTITGLTLPSDPKAGCQQINSVAFTWLACGPNQVLVSVCSPGDGSGCVAQSSSDNTGALGTIYCCPIQ